MYVKLCILNLILNELLLTDRSCGRALAAAPRLYPSGNSDTRPAHIPVGIKLNCLATEYAS